MILVTMYHVDHNCRKVRSVFDNNETAKNFCDYYQQNGWVIYSVESCDFTLSDLLEGCWAV